NQQVHHAVMQWLHGLDSGDLDLMVHHTHDDVVICNEHQPTTIGIQPFKDKYGPRIQAMNFKSTCEAQHIQVFGNDVTAIWVGRFSVEAASKESGETMKAGSGRLCMTLLKVDGVWKMLSDVDNNDETDPVKK
ncbi:MAG: hypothetical protein SGILL_007507, partial [Bacillariaceae sp.]